jgi:transcriptional regulator GlxA family with amidase domain
LNHIEKHLGEKLSVTELAKKVSLERAYFSTLFSKIFKISPALYINRKRIERAQKLLCETDLKLEALAQELGFTDAFHLSKTFKKFTGVSPSEFRKRKANLIP